jgi:DNA-binding NtrC family response regulator
MNRPTTNVLIVDKDDGHSTRLSGMIQAQSLGTLPCASLAQAEQSIREHGETIAAAFIALDLPDGEGLELLRRDDLLPDHTEVALIHDEDDTERASQGISLQARYFFRKPVDEGFVSLLLKDISKEWEAAADRETEMADYGVDQFGLLRGSSRPMRKLYRTIRKVAPTRVAALLIGESGTGKELVAETIHMLSGVEGPFVAVNCGAIPAELAESELFGHEKGSFSGADRTHAGCFERAEAGTLFLDEISEMPMDIQVKLLRVLETNRYRRVGGEREHDCNVRIITATNRELESAIRAGSLREDLYFRVAQFPLHMPALRDRGNDRVGLAQHFLNGLNEQQGTAKAFSDSAIEAIEAYRWPGNVRELRSAVERAFIMADETLHGEHFPLEQLHLEPESEYVEVPVGEPLQDTEKRLILATLEATSGDKKEAAQQLGISLKTLYNRLNEYQQT